MDTLSLVKTARAELIEADVQMEKMAKSLKIHRKGLEKQADDILSLRKEVNLLREKVAALENEKVARELVDQMVDRGLLEKDQAPAKMAELQKEPSKIQVVKEAVGLWRPGANFILAGECSAIDSELARTPDEAFAAFQSKLLS